MVSALMTDSGHWNEELIRETFIPVDAAVILQIPLRSQVDEDCWAWEPEKHGMYSVKTAYQKLEQDQQKAALPVQGCSGEQFWKEIWKLSVPPKVRVFWWRVLHEFLPAKQM